MRIVETNPVLFVQALVKGIADGFYVQNTIPGAPSLASVLEVELFPGKPEVTEISGDKITITGYSSHEFLLGVQNAILNGFEPVLESVNFYGLKLVELKRASVAPVVVETKIETKIETSTEAGPKRGRKSKTL